MSRAIWAVVIAAVFGFLTPCQSPPIILYPVDGTSFGDYSQICLGVSGDPLLQGGWGISSDAGAGGLLFPSFPGADNGFCLPREIKPWDPPSSFSLSYCTPSNDCAQKVNCTLSPSGSIPPPEPLTLKEVSFRRKHNKYYLRLLVRNLESEQSCLQLRLGYTILPITKYEVSGDLAYVEAMIGNESQFITVAMQVPDLVFKDGCTNKEYSRPPVPPGKQGLGGIVFGYNHGKLVMLGAEVFPHTGCEVMFISWYDPAGGWLPNYPTYCKYDGCNFSGGYLLPSTRQFPKGAILLARVYDYCTGEFVGFAWGGSKATNAASPFQQQDVSPRIIEVDE